MEQNFRVPVLHEGEKEIIRQAGNFMKFSRGSNLFVPGDTADRVYLVGNGWLKIYHLNQDGGQVTVGALRGPGELVGLAEALAGGQRSCYASAVADVTASVVPKESFLELMATEPFLAVKVTKLLTGRMLKTEHLI